MCVSVMNFAVSGLTARLNDVVDAVTNGTVLNAQLDASGAEASINQRLDALTTAIDYYRTRLYAYERPVELSGDMFTQVSNTEAGLSGLYNSMSLDFKVSQKAR